MSATTLANELFRAAIAPAAVPNASEESVVPFLMDPYFIPRGERRWSKTGFGTLDAKTGRFTAEQAQPGATATVSCETWRNGVLYAKNTSNISTESVRENEGWKVLDTFNLILVDFPSTDKSILYANGRQQLQVYSNAVASGEFTISPGELDTLTLFEKLGHQQVSTVSDPEVGLTDKTIHWATASTYNSYERASDSQPQVSSKPRAYVDHFLHSLAPSGSKQFYAGFRDRYGRWHYSNTESRTSLFSVTPYRRELQPIVEQLEIQGFNIPPDPMKDPNKYHYNYKTVEYWVFTLKNFPIRSIKFLGDKTSMVRWERDFPGVKFCSYTGYIVGKDKQDKVLFDSAALENLGFSSGHLLVPVKPINSDQFAITNHRVVDVGYQAEPTKLQGPISALLIDRYGSEIKLTIKFQDKEEEDHRDVLVHNFETIIN